MREPSALEYLAHQLLITSQQVALVLGVSKNTVFRMVEGGLLHPVHCTPGSGAYRFRLRDVAQYLERANEGEA